MRTLTLTVALLVLIPISFYASARSNSGGLSERVAELEAQVEVLAAALQDAQEILQFVHVETREMDFLAGPHWIIEGANVHVRSGAGSTREGCLTSDPNYPNCENLTGLGNLIVGYNEFAFPHLFPATPLEARTGSHNLVVGTRHSYTAFGGFVAGVSNRVTGALASVTGGESNEASGLAASVTGGQSNEASGHSASVSGGNMNLASGGAASVSGGFRNVASGRWSSVSGGADGVALDSANWVAGELFESN